MSKNQSEISSFLAIGRFHKAHGVRGEIRVAMHTDLPERFTWLETVYVGETQLTPYKVESVRFHKGYALIKLEGIDQREAIEQLRHEWLMIPESEAIPLEEGEYFYHDLIGLSVETADGTMLGTIKEILETGANDVFVVKQEKGELLLPDIEEVVKEIDIDNSKMIVSLIDGLA